MKVKFINSQYNNDMLKMKPQSLEQDKLKENIKQNYNNKHTNRPAQAISFSGSAISGAQKVFNKIGNSFIQSKKINGLVKYVNKNEAGFNAIYALIIAGMLKPGLVLAQTGYDDKDGQMIATKNFVQAFIGFILGMTVGGGFVKKIYDTMTDNLKLINVQHNQDGVTLSPKDMNSDSMLNAAKKSLINEHSTFKDRWNHTKGYVQIESEIPRKIKAFFREIKKTDYKPTEIEIREKAKDIAENFQNNHFKVFDKNKSTREFTAMLVDNMNELASSPNSARANLKNGLKSQPFDAFGSFWKNSTGVVTAIAKAKISSLLLPIMVGALFAKRNTEIEMKKKHEKKENASKMAISKSLENNTTFNKIHNRNNNISFGASHLQSAIDATTKALETGAVSKTGQWLANTVSKISKKPSHLMSHVESFGITLYWLLNTHFSKKIDPDQKLGLNVHTALVTIVSSLASLIIDNGSDILIKKAQNLYENKIESTITNIKQNAKPDSDVKELAQQAISQCSKLYNAEGIKKALSKNDILSDTKKLKSAIEGLGYTYSKHLSKAKSLLIFITVVRFLVPVLTVKQSKKIKKFLLDVTQKRADKKQQKQSTKTEKTA